MSDVGMHRLTVRITDKQYYDLGNILTKGEYQALFGIIVDSLIELHKQHGKIAIYAIMAGEIDFLKTILKK